MTVKNVIIIKLIYKEIIELQLAELNLTFKLREKDSKRNERNKIFSKEILHKIRKNITKREIKNRFKALLNNNKNTEDMNRNLAAIIKGVVGKTNEKSNNKGNYSK